LSRYSAPYMRPSSSACFSSTSTATPALSTLSLHDALPILPSHPPQREKTVPDTEAQAVPGSNQVVEPTSMTGAQAIVRSLEELDVTDVFGLPGGAILPTYDPLMDTSRIRHILVRHEQGAGHAAQ